MAPKKPVIAINCDFDISMRPDPDTPHYRDRIILYKNYYLAVTEAGGVPLLVPPSNREVLESYLGACDGILLTGGEDYPPEAYGEAPHPETKPGRPERADSDLVWILMALNSEKPLLGICAGLQLVQIASGGKLIQHLETEIKHSADMEADEEHAVEVEAGSRLAEVLGPGKIHTNSAHHQAADPKHLGKGLKVVARAADGVIEALEPQSPNGRFFLAVQWHPERIKDVEHRKKVFKAFIDACARG